MAPPPSQELAPVIGIMEALKSSLAALKKPPVAEEEAAGVQQEVVSKDKGKAVPTRVRAAG